MKPHIKTSIELIDGFATTEDRHSQVMRVVKGKAWVTMDGQDYAVKEGEQLALTPGTDRAVITSADKSPLVYEVVN